MVSLKRILVPTDYSECSREAFRLALSLAPTLGATIDVAHVWSAPFFGPEYDGTGIGDGHQSLFELIRSTANEEMTRFIAAEGVPESVRVQSHVHSGEPTTALLALAEQLAADLIVVGTHGRTGAKYLVLGSVATRLVRFSTCPVLTVPPRQA